jgi:hypothetical protein
VLVIQGFGEIGDFPAVELSKVWMQARHWRRRCLEPSTKLDTPGLQDSHLVLDCGAGDARFDGFNEPSDLALDLLQLARSAFAIAVLFGPLPIQFPVELVDKDSIFGRISWSFRPAKTVASSWSRRIASKLSQVPLLRAVEQP